MRSSGVFSHLSLATWNTRVALVDDKVLAARKFGVIKSTAASHSHTLLQEIGGNKLSINNFSNKFQASHYVGHSWGYGSARGVLSLHRKSDHQLLQPPTFTALVEGRALLSTLVDKRCTFLVYNIHFYQLTKADLQKVNESLSRSFDLARAQPLKYCVLVGGDFNFDFPDKPAVRLPHYTFDESIRTFNSYKSCGLAKTLNRAVRVQHDCYTHYSSANEHLNDTDHVFFGMPSWILPHFTYRTTIRCPTEMWQKGLSDHGVLSVQVSRKPRSERTCKIPHWVTKLPRYAEALGQLLEVARLDELIPAVRLAHHKELIHEASRVARDDHADRHRDCKSMRLHNATLIARMVLGKNVALAQRLIRNSSYFFSRIKLAGNQVVLVDPSAFQAEYFSLKAEACNNSLRGAVDLPDGPRKDGKIQQAVRLAALWKASGPSLSLHALTLEDGTTVESSQSMLQALGVAWAPTFEKQGKLDPAVHDFLSNLHSWSDAVEQPPPGVNKFKASIIFAKPSEPGPDGIPYSAWAACVDASAATLFEANVCLLSGGFLGFDFNEQFAIFIRKNDGLPRPPRAKETRPLGLKNSAPKLMTTTTVRPFNKVASNRVAKIQNGFVGGRQFTSNVSTVETLGRTMSLQGGWSHEAVLALWDFAAAFPSLYHCWILAVFTALKFPDGYVDFLEAIFYHNVAFGLVSGDPIFLYFILCGIIQGCPSSGQVFAIATHPFFKMLEQKQEQLNRARPSSAAIRGCADDISAALGSYKFFGPP